MVNPGGFGKVHLWERHKMAAGGNTIPRMISDQERAYLQEYAKKEFIGQGDIVDLGCWMGASSVALAKGLKKNREEKARNRVVHAYDIFVWEAWMDQCVVNTPLWGKYRPGDHFFEECEKRTRPWKDRIKFHPGDLTQIGWDGGPIEFLFIDAMKSWELANSIIIHFFPHLIPGQSIVVHQDFSHFGTYWIHLVMYRLRDYFEPVKDIPKSWSLVFQYIKPIPDHLLNGGYHLASFSTDEIKKAFEYSGKMVSLEKQCQILGAKVIALLHKGEISQASDELERAIARGLSLHDHELPLGLGFPSVILDLFSRREKGETLCQPDTIREERPAIDVVSEGDLTYTEERHITGQPGSGLSFSHLVHMARYAFVFPYIEAKDVLDIACGSGYGSQYLALQGARKVVGVDVDPKAIEYARKYHSHERVSFIQSDAHNLSQIEDASFDVIVSFETIEHLREPKSFLLELRRLLKTGGTLFISCPNDYAESPWKSKFHLHKFRFNEFRDLIVTVFGEAIFLGHHNTIASGLFKPAFAGEKTTYFEAYRRPIPTEFFGSQYMDSISPIENAYGYIAVVGIDPSRLGNQIIFSQDAFQDFMGGHKYVSEEL